MYLYYKIGLNLRNLNLLLSVLVLTACAPAESTFRAVHSAFMQGCDTSTIITDLKTEDSTLIIRASCTKKK